MTSSPDAGARNLPRRFAEALANRYTIEHEIGRGGMATVYLAHDLRHERTVALKLLHPDLSHDLGSERFLREIHLAARLSHPHIVPLYDSGEAAGLLYYVMPRIEGESLRARLDREGQLPLDDALRLTREVAEAIDYAHAQGVVHRDIKPENILVSGGHALVADFGIARAVGVSAGDRLTATGMAVGTPAYMSPEQAAGGQNVDPRTDVYSLACVAYEMLAGMPPFTASTPQALMARHLVDPVAPIHTVRNVVTPAMDAVLTQGLAKVSPDRPSSAVRFARALEEARTATATTAPPPHRRLRLGVASLAAIGIVLVGLVMLKIRPFTGTGGLPHLATLAVLPFDNLAGDTAQDYFVADMHDALVGALGQVSPLRVTWGSLAAYSHTRKTDEQVAHELGVNGLVRASVLRSGDSVEYQVRLIEAIPQQRLLWSHTYSSPVRATLALNGEVARAIASELRVDLTADQARRLSQSQELSPAEYEAYLRGMYYIGRQRPADIRKGLGFLEEAVEKDPGDAHAWAALAQGYVLIGHSPASPADVWQRARAAAERAVGLDPDLADAQTALAEVKDYYEHDWAGAEAAFRRANELNPNLAGNHAHYAFMMELLGRPDEAIAEYRKAVDIDPLTPGIRGNFAWLENWTGHPKEGLRQALMAYAADSLHPIVLVALGDAYMLNGDTAKGLAEFKRVAALSPPWRAYYAAALARAGRVTQARQLVTELERQPVNAGGALFLGIAHAVLGDMDQAFHWFAYQPEHGWLPWLRVWPDLDALRRDPRFPALLRHLNLPPLPTGSHGASG